MIDAACGSDVDRQRAGRFMRDVVAASAYAITHALREHATAATPQ